VFALSVFPSSLSTLEKKVCAEKKRVLVTHEKIKALVVSIIHTSATFLRLFPFLGVSVQQGGKKEAWHQLLGPTG
jgi:hypothetical protein